MRRSDDVVSLAYVHDAEVAHSWHQSVMALVAHDITNSQHVARGMWLATKYGTGGIAQARNDTARRFLTDTTSDWLLWIDTDMGFAANSVDRLLDVADPDACPVVGGLCFAMKEVGVDGMGGMIVQPKPTLYGYSTEAGFEGFRNADDYPRDQVVPVAGTGSAFILIHRSALERVAEAYGPEWYTPTLNPATKSFMSEDLSFCVRLGSLGIPVHVHTGVQTSHLKYVWLDERLADRLTPAMVPA